MVKALVVGSRNYLPSKFRDVAKILEHHNVTEIILPKIVSFNVLAKGTVCGFEGRYVTWYPLCK